MVCAMLQSGTDKHALLAQISHKQRHAVQISIARHKMYWIEFPRNQQTQCANTLTNALKKHFSIETLDVMEIVQAVQNRR